MIRCVSLLLVLAFASVAAASPDAPVVQTTAGWVRGDAADGAAIFRGIPYAAPPIGALRWRSPQPVAKWDGVRDATAFGASCPQSLDSPMMMVGPLVKTSEDCLTLNVWTPAATRAAKRPVMLWIYGGGFFTGAGSEEQFDGAPYTKRGVVLVTINYRLGRLGFFAHPSLKPADAGEPQGNYGLMDVLAALRWVRDNISAFGGNPGNVTIFGESAGGIAVVDLMASPFARGLFQKAIVESGAFPRPMREIATDRPDEPSEQTLGRTFAEGLGIKSLDAAALRALPVEKIAPGASGDLVQIQAMASPMVDGAMFREDAFASFARGHIAKVPLLIGSTGAEALVWAFGRDGKMATYPLLPFDPARFRSAYGSDADRIMAAYGSRYGGDMAKAGPILATDMAVGAGSRFLADRGAAAGCPTFLYHFATMPTPLRGLVPGAPHGTEIPYVFGTLSKLRNVGSGMTEGDQALSRTVIDYWVSFAKTGNPNGAGRPSWPSRDGKNGAYLDFTDRGPAAAVDDPIMGIFEQSVAATFAAPAAQ